LPLFSRRASQIRILSRHSRFLAFALTGIWCSILLLPSGVRAQLRLLPEDQYHQIRDNASGELPFLDFARLIRFSGFAPSKGADEIAGALSAEATADGLTGVGIERYESDGSTYNWAFRKEPYWEGRRAELWLVKPDLEELANFRVSRSYLGRNSRSAEVTAELVDVGRGTALADYEGRSVAGKIVLASGSASQVMQLAVWERKALGVVSYHTDAAMTFPDQIELLQIVPWSGPHGEVPTFAFSLSARDGSLLKTRLATGETLTVRADVEADSGAGAYPEVTAEIPGTEPGLPEVLVYAHSNSRNTGGANNLTGVGCTLEVARLLNSLITRGLLPRPRRTIRFMWGPEHYGITNHFHRHLQDLEHVLAMINVDMIGFNQQTARAVLHLTRSPDSNPSFVDDVVQSFLEQVGHENTISLRNDDVTATDASEGFFDPFFAPTGSREQLHYNVERFCGPSDHEDAQALHVRAIMLNDFPDVFLSSQQDSVAAGDPTQMRRGVVLTAASAYFLAAATADQAPKLLRNALAKAQARLGEDEERAYQLLEVSGDAVGGYGRDEALNIVKHAFIRESASLSSLSEWVGSAKFAGELAPFMKVLSDSERAALGRVDEYAKLHASRSSQTRGAPGAVSGYSLIPVRTCLALGPVNVFRPEYGRWWLIEKTGDVHFEKNLKLSQRGTYFTYEALNFIDGTRTIADIRDAISAEFDPVPTSEVVQYFQFMEKLGVVRLANRRSPANAQPFSSCR
jgi:aminopeptidase YwaD